MNSVAIVGGGESGIGAALLAKEKGLDVFVTDYGEIRENFKKELIDNNIPFEEKGHNIERIGLFDVIVKSPGVPDKAELIQIFRLRQKTIISEIEFASRYFDGKIIGVTGSNGKTTTASLIYHLIENINLKSALAGNIGNSFSRLLLGDAQYDLVVLELSSFQLDDVLNFKVDIAAILNITPDHLDRYDYDLMKYAKAKWNLAHCVKESGHLILKEDDDILQELSAEANLYCQTHWISGSDPQQHLQKKDGSLYELALLGRHNAFNAAVARSVAELLDTDVDQIEKRLKSFKSIEHRLEYVATINGIKFINDSKATNVDSVVYALEAFDQTIVWIAGGTDKGNDYSQIDESSRNRIRALICVCKDDSKLRSSFSELEDIVSTQDIVEGVKMAFGRAERGDVVLLSPACASFDLFDNYQDRGRKFKDAVYKLLSESRK